MDYCKKGDGFSGGDVGLGKTYMKTIYIYRKNDRVEVHRKYNHWLAVSNEKWGITGIISGLISTSSSPE